MDTGLDLREAFRACRLCPRECGAARLEGETGFCGVGAGLRIARAALHFWEEPCLSGEGEHPPGSGAVFFAGCNLGCLYCQNRAISRGKAGIPVAPERLPEILLELQEQGALNINLVTASHYVPYLPEAIRAARERGLRIPVVYNTSSYEKPETLALLRGSVEIYLPDFKYWSGETAARYSQAPDYPETALSAIDEMLAQTGEPVFDEQGILKRGVIIRHLLLPGCLADSKRVLRHLYKRYGSRVYFSLMSQYTPMQDVPAELARPVSRREYRQLVDYALSLGIENAFIQEGEVALESFIPSFNGEGVLRRD